MSALSRRDFLALSAGASAGALLLDLAPLVRRAGAAVGEEPLGRLMAGNKRFVASKLTHPNQGKPRRTALTRGQQPFAAILGCADSRVPPEVLFDQGLGDLFVVRVAGNVADSPAIGSLEYAAAELHVPLIIVLGHSRCGAVDAALKTASGVDLPGGIKSLVDAILPAVLPVKDCPGDMLDNAVRANVAHVVGRLRSTKPVLAGPTAEGKLRIVGGHYDLETGVVEVLG
jgi:carbonic anhydrase